jgi:hypothetical protein
MARSSPLFNGSRAGKGLQDCIERMNRNTRTLLSVAVALGCIGLLAWAGLGLTRRRPSTAAEVSQYVNSVNLSRLAGVQRNAALIELEDKVNSMTLEERRKWWLSGQWRGWFERMTEDEKGQYIEATLPTGLKQVLNAFERLPDVERSKAIDDAMHQLKLTHHLVTDHEPGHAESMYGTNASPVLSQELENRARMVGFKSFYVDSSPQTKAELAPLVEELQHQLEFGSRVGQ